MSEFGDTPETTKPIDEEKETPVIEVDEKEPHEAKEVEDAMIEKAKVRFQFENI